MFSVEIHVLIVGMASLAGSMAGTSISQDTPSARTPIQWDTHLLGHPSARSHILLGYPSDATPIF